MSCLTRIELLDRIRETETWDIVVIGGGATGLGTAVDAASRGYRTLLLEGNDFAKGTSSRSTKLVHGGVRYLGQGNVSLVREALHERGLLARNAPHLTHTMEFVIPAYRWSDRAFYGIGLKLYDQLAGKLSFGSTKLISPQETLDRVPTLRPQGLRGGIVYYDGQFDDARLAIALLRTLLDEGGTAVNYMPVTALIKTGSRITGLKVRDAESGEELEIGARVVVNATGVYADAIRRMDAPDAKPMITPSQGVHLVLDRSFLPSDSAIMIPRTDDGRVLFAIPWHGRTVFGTTDTEVTDISIEPQPLDKEVEFLLQHAARYLSKVPKHEDVLSVFAGLRPLVKGADGKGVSALSRDHSLVVSPSGLVTITGGKWTTYRRMAELTVDRASQVASLPNHSCVTGSLKLHGWTAEPDAGVYGSDATEMEKLSGWDDHLHPNLPYRSAEVIWAVRQELARTVEDVLSRRTRALLLDARASIQIAPKVAKLIATELGFGDCWQQDQVRSYTDLASRYLLGDDLWNSSPE